MSYPSDPLFSAQWHLGRIGNLAAIWEDYTGAGVAVGVYDDGIQYSHPDLAQNYDASKHVSYNGDTFDGVNVGNNGHGTSVAGLIAAAANEEGGVGVAFDASLTGVNIFDPASDLFINLPDPQGFYAAIAQSNTFDVVNNSWGSTPGFVEFQNLNVAGSFAAETAAGWEDAAETGRGGLGTIVLKAAGNDTLNANGEGLNVVRHAITVAAVGDSGFAASYSNHGSNILVSAPGSEFASNDGLGIVTTDLLGSDGYNLRSDEFGEHDYTDDFGGTSAATPIVSGVVALMLQANPNLGWRDVQDILAMSATHTGSGIGASTPGAFEDGNWIVNGADNWNGGGMHFHVNYGYGMVNAYNAVRMAEAWTLFGPAKTSANEDFLQQTVSVEQPITDFNTTSGSFTLGSSREVERVEVTVTLTHSYFTDLVIELVAPDGTVHVLADRSTGSSSVASDGLTWTFMVEGLRGVSANGDWTVRVADQASFDEGTLHSVSYRIFGDFDQAADVYHFTDEFALMAFLDAGRRLVTDTDGGTDWLNMAAMSADLIVNLNNLAYSSVNGQQFIRIADGTVIENVITGDGDDIIFGNGADNDLRGGRGNDVFYVNGAGDSVFEKAGQGSDLVAANVSFTLGAGAEVETLRTTRNAGTTAIDLTGNEFSQTIIGNDGNNVLRSGGGTDTMRGLDGNDTYFVGNLDGSPDDIVIEGIGKGNDIVASATSYVLNAGAEVETLRTTSNGGIEAINLTGNAFSQTIIGNAGNNILKGGGGADAFQGLGGNDTYFVDSLDDTIAEAVDKGNDTVAASASYVLNAGAEVETLRTTSNGGTGAINLTGNELGQTIIGNAGNNILKGGGGADAFQGLGGDDTYFVDSLDDTIAEAVGKGNDTVAASASYVLNAGAEVETLRTTSNGGTGAINLTGNEFGQTIIGNAGDNILSAGAAGAADTMTGLGGNDTYRVYNAGDIIVETSTQGTADKVISAVDYTLGAGVHVEIMQTNGATGTSGIDLTGNEFAQTITGNAGANILDGKGGNDTLAGGAGKDFFLFSSALGVSNVDTINGFSVADDTIRLENAIFTALTTTGTLAAAAFRANTTGLAGDASDRVIYETDTGRLFYDADGTGATAGIHFATVTAGLALTNADFVVV